MRKIIFIILSLLCTVAYSQEKISDIWLAIPNDMVIYVDSTMRQDLVKLYETDGKSSVNNKFTGITSIDTLSKRYMSISMNAVTRWQLRLLDKSDSTRMLCLVKTFTPEEGHGESEILFYSTDWNKDDSTYGLPISDNEDELLKTFTYCPDTMILERYEELKAMIEPVMLCAELSADEETMILYLSTPLLSKKEEEEVKAIIKRTKLNWNGETFK